MGEDIFFLRYFFLCGDVFYFFVVKFVNIIVVRFCMNLKIIKIELKDLCLLFG